MARTYLGSVHYHDHARKPMTLEEKQERQAKRQQKSLLLNEESLLLYRLVKEHPELNSGPLEDRGQRLNELAADEKRLHPLVIRWYVASMDEIVAEFDTLEKAVEECQFMTMDGRKHPAVRKLGIGLYEYTASRNYEGRVSQYCIGTRESLIAEGYDLQVDEWEKTVTAAGWRKA